MRPLVQLFVLFVFLCGSLFVGNAQAQPKTTLFWECGGASCEPDLAGFKLYYGLSSGIYSNILDVGNIFEYPAGSTLKSALMLRAGIPYYFAITAYDTVGNESGYSNEVFMSFNVDTPIGLVVKH